MFAAISLTTWLYEWIGILIPHFEQTTPAIPQWSSVIVGTANDMASSNTVVVASPNDDITCRSHRLYHSFSLFLTPLR